MSDTSKALLALIGKKSRVVVAIGTYRGLESFRMLVDFDEGGRIAANPATDYRPAINEQVWVWTIDDVAYVVGPTRPLPADGVIVSAASGIATVSTDIGNVDATYPFGASLSAGQEVRLHWGGDTPHVIGVKSTTPAPPAPGGGGGGGTREYSRTFTARSAGSFNSSWWTSQVWAADDNLGIWTYGTKIGDTIPAGASIISIEIYLPIVSTFGDPANFALHNYANRPGGAPDLFSPAARTPRDGWLTLPDSFGTALRRGGPARGVGVEHGGFHKFAALASDAMSGALRIRYRA